MNKNNKMNLNKKIKKCLYYLTFKQLFIQITLQIVQSNYKTKKQKKNNLITSKTILQILIFNQIKVNNIKKLNHYHNNKKTLINKQNKQKYN